MITPEEAQQADDVAAMLDKIEELQEANARLEQENRDHCDEIAALQSREGSLFDEITLLRDQCHELRAYRP